MGRVQVEGWGQFAEIENGKQRERDQAAGPSLPAGGEGGPYGSKGGP